MNYFANWYYQLLSALDKMVDCEPEKSKKKPSTYKYIFASVFPDSETMDIALGTIEDFNKEQSYYNVANLKP